MFNKNFYPSTPEVVQLMLEPYISEHKDYYSGKLYLRGVKRILDPEAGKGDILDYVISNFADVKKEDLYCCEIEDDLVAILQRKGYRVLERDFLKLSDPYQFDLILANPPFSRGAEHALKMWDTLELFGGEMVVQLNKETIENPYSWERQRLLTIIRDNGGQIEDIGRPYRSAERTTDVEVVIVRLKRSASRASTNFDASQYEKDSRYSDFAYNENSIVSADGLQALVASYEAARTCLVEGAKINARYRFYTYGLESNYTPPGAQKKDLRKNAEEAQSQLQLVSLNEQIAALKKKYWKYLFDRTKVADVTTSKVQAEFMSMVEATSAIAFTYENVAKVFQKLLSESGDTMKKCVVETFDKMCSYDSENKIHSEGWVTNDAYKVNQKVILPLRTQRYGGWGTYWDSHEQAVADDIDKAMCFVAGKKYSEILSIRKAVELLVDDLRTGRKWNHQENVFSEFFKIRIYKKGTIHIYFKDVELWEKFNIMAAQEKKWIGAETMHKHGKRVKRAAKSAQQGYDRHFK